MDSKFNVFKKVLPESPKLQEIVERYKTDYHNILDSLVVSKEDMQTLEEMALEAATGSPEAQEAFKQVLVERNEGRIKQGIHKKYTITKEGILVNKGDTFGEKIDETETKNHLN
jgi:hypothetical protein